MERRNETVLITHFHETEEAKTKRKSLLTLGIIMMALGLISIAAAPFVTIFSVMVLGIILIGGGIAQLVQSFWTRKWSGFFLSLLMGILYLAIGFVCAAKPITSAAGITLVMSAFFLIGGLFRSISSIILRFHQWGWAFIHGLITFLLGVIIFSEWPYSGLWIIGLFIGIELLLTGTFLTMITCCARKN